MLSLHPLWCCKYMEEIALSETKMNLPIDFQTISFPASIISKLFSLKVIILPLDGFLLVYKKFHFENNFQKILSDTFLIL